MSDGKWVVNITLVSHKYKVFDTHEEAMAFSTKFTNENPPMNPYDDHASGSYLENPEFVPGELIPALLEGKRIFDTIGIGRKNFLTLEEVNKVNDDD